MPVVDRTQDVSQTFGLDKLEDTSMPQQPEQQQQQQRESQGGQNASQQGETAANGQAAPVVAATSSKPEAIGVSCPPLYIKSFVAPTR